jgi:hypothetical protein
MNLHDIDACTPLADAEREAARQRLGIDPACFVVLDVVLHGGSLAPRDGIDTVILAVARLRQRHGVNSMLMVAHGTAASAEPARLRALARALCMEPHVRFICDPPPGALRDCHTAANVMVSAPWSATGSHAARDAEALAEQLARLQRRPLMAQAMGDASRAHLSNSDNLEKKATS